MTKSSLTSLLMAAALALPAAALSLPLEAQAPAPRPHPHRGQGGPFFMAKALGLSEGQRKSVHDIFEKHREGIRAAHARAAEARKALVDAMQDPKAEEGRLRELHNAAADAHFQAAMAFRAAMLEARTVLTPEQQAKADAMKAEMRSHREAMRRFFLEGAPKPAAPGAH